MLWFDEKVYLLYLYDFLLSQCVSMYMFFALAIIMPNFFFAREEVWNNRYIISYDRYIYDESALGPSSKSNPNIISICGWIELFEEKLRKKMGKNLSQYKYMLLVYTYVQ